MTTENNSTDDSSLEVMKSWMSQNIACISESASVQDAGDRAAEMKENWVEWINDDDDDDDDEGGSSGGGEGAPARKKDKK